MDKLHYLADPDVRGFTEYLRTLVVRGNGAAIHVGRGSRRRPVATLAEAAQAFRWRGRDLLQVNADREHFREQLLQALALCGDGMPGCRPASAEYELLYVCTRVLEWANAGQGAMQYVRERAQAQALSASLARAAALMDGDAEAAGVFDGVRLLSCPQLGHLYAIVNQRTVVYGSRLAAALCLACRHYLTTGDAGRRDIVAVPPLIDYRLPNPRPRRDPSLPCGPRFRPVTDTSQHSRWNLRANWVLDAVAGEEEVAAALGGSRPERLRSLEAALFMVGDRVAAPYQLAARAPRRVAAGRRGTG